jgi:hypothetical protein
MVWLVNKKCLIHGNSMDKSKRRIAKALGVTGAGAAVWKKPVVESVSLPAHASVSCACAPCVSFGADESIAASVFNAWHVPVAYQSMSCTGVGETIQVLFHYIQCPPGSMEAVPNCTEEFCDPGGFTIDITPEGLEASCKVYVWGSDG